MGHRWLYNERKCLVPFDITITTPPDIINGHSFCLVFIYGLLNFIYFVIVVDWLFHFFCILLYICSWDKLLINTFLQVSMGTYWSLYPLLRFQIKLSVTRERERALINVYIIIYPNVHWKNKIKPHEVFIYTCTRNMYNI